MFRKFFYILLFLNVGVLAVTSFRVFGIITTYGACDKYSQDCLTDFFTSFGVLVFLILPLYFVYVFGKQGMDRRKGNRVVHLVIAEIIALGMVVLTMLVFSGLGFGLSGEQQRETANAIVLPIIVFVISYIVSGLFLLIYSLSSSRT
jgi:hypothetical protein